MLIQLHPSNDKRYSDLDAQPHTGAIEMLTLVNRKKLIEAGRGTRLGAHWPASLTASTLLADNLFMPCVIILPTNLPTNRFGL